MVGKEDNPSGSPREAEHVWTGGGGGGVGIGVLTG